jgi:RNA polymerase sigma-70 factor (ECF subfamily)
LEAHAPAVHALLLRLTLRRDVADELLQDLFVRAASRAAGVDNPGAYLRRAAVNLAMDWRRTRGRQRVAAAAELPDVPDERARTSPAQAVENAETVARILDAAARLGEPSRAAFALRFVQGESYDAIGAAIGGRTAHQARGLCHAAVTEIRRKLAVRQVAHARPGRPQRND